MPKWSTKSDVDTSDMRPEIIVILDAAAASIWIEEGVELFVTTGRDGPHMLGSKHYEGHG